MHVEHTSRWFELVPNGTARPAHQPGRPLALMSLNLFMGLVALVCGGLLMVDGLGMPQSALDHAPFDSFVVPGLLLGVVVGGSLVLAARLIWFVHRLAPLASLVSGGILLGWITIEATMVDDGRALQLGILVYALVIVALSLRYRRRQLAQEGGDR